MSQHRPTVLHLHRPQSQKVPHPAQNRQVRAPLPVRARAQVTVRAHSSRQSLRARAHHRPGRLRVPALHRDRPHPRPTSLHPHIARVRVQALRPARLPHHAHPRAPLRVPVPARSHLIAAASATRTLLAEGKSTLRVIREAVRVPPTTLSVATQPATVSTPSQARWGRHQGSRVTYAMMGHLRRCGSTTTQVTTAPSFEKGLSNARLPLWHKT